MSDTNNLSHALETSVMDIVDNVKPGSFRIEMYLVSPTNKDVTYQVNLLKSISIVQQFSDLYTDFIDVDFEVTTEQYFNLMKYSQDLRCVIKLIPFDPKEQTEIKSLKTIVLNSRIIFRDKEDLLKNFPVKDLQPSNEAEEYEQHHAQRIPISGQLIDPLSYNLRKYQLNFIARETNIGDIVRFVMNVADINKLYFVSPDNTRTYTNFIIPPMMDLSNVLGYLQEDAGKGIYHKGFNYYYTNKVMYVYPLYETSPSSPETVHIYKVTPNMFTGLDSYHMTKNSDVHLICNSQSINSDMIDQGIENSGSAAIVQKSEQIIDNWREMQEDGWFNVINADNTLNYNLNTSKGVVKDAYLAKFKFSKDNVFVHTSEMAKNNVVTNEIVWNHAVPFTFKPGWKICYHYDDENGYRMDTGSCAGVIYDIQPTPERMHEQIYTCSAKVNMFMNLKK